MLGRDCAISQGELITHTIRYLDGEDYDVWNSCPAARGQDWEDFRRRITDMYPGAEDENQYSVTDLEIYVENQATVPMNDQNHFGDYYRKFIVKANWLIDRRYLSRRERDKLFLAGFHIDFRNQLRTQLRLQDPRHPLTEPWYISEVEQAA